MAKPDYLYPNAVIAVFAKAPIPGQVKTRMQPDLTPEESAQLQSKLIQHTLTTAINSNVAPVQLWAAPDTHHPEFQKAALTFPITLHEQKNGSLGHKMLHCFKSNKTKDFVVIIGSDCPSLTQQHFLDTAQHLSANNNSVIVPAFDGGYVLIGSQHAPNCFENIDWGSEKVLQQTLAQLPDSTHLLKPLHDLDHYQDFIHLPPSLQKQLLT